MIWGLLVNERTDIDYVVGSSEGFIDGLIDGI